MKGRLLAFTLVAKGAMTCLPATVFAEGNVPPRPMELAQSQRIVDPACFCWANGERFNRGEAACLRTGNGRQLAMCDQVTNVMSWSFSQNPCPES